MRKKYEYIPEGLDESEDDTSSEVAQSFDPNSVRVETRTTTVNNIISRIESGEIDLAPAFQRKAGIWKNRAQSRLIESLLIRIPIPAFYFDGTDENRWVVIDGLQRLTTFRRFIIDKELRLTELEFLGELDKFSYDDLPRNLQRRIQETQLTVYLIGHGTPDEIKFAIFRRINTEGKPLSPQEIRHALNQGKSTVLLEELSQCHEFRRGIAEGVSDERMEDRELVLRFLAFAIHHYRTYNNPNLDVFLHKTMQTINSYSDVQIDVLRKRFKRAMIAAYRIFGHDAFRKRYDEEHGRKPVNKSLFEAWSVNLDALSDEQIDIVVSRASDVKKRFIALMNNRDFDQAVSQGTGDISKVLRRFGAIEELLLEVILDDQKG